MTRSELHNKIGALLKLERARQKIELADLATTLKITEANLQAVEDGDASQLPSELYFKLFAKSYAEELGIDYEATIEAIQLDLEERPMDELSSGDLAGDHDRENSSVGSGSSSEDAPPTDGKNGNQLKKLAYIFGVVLVVFIGVVIANEFFFQDTDLETEADSMQVETVQHEPAVVSANNDTGGYAWNVPAYSSPKPMTLVLTARSDSWATILADGDTAVYRTLTPGRRYEVTAKYRLRVSVGVPSAVTIELNGQPVNLRDPESARISVVKIDQINLKEFLNRPLTQTRTGATQTQRQPVTAAPEALVSSTDDTVSTIPESVVPSQPETGPPEDTSESR